MSFVSSFALVLSCFIFYVCTFPVLFCSILLSSHFRHFTSCPCMFPASLITCPALISFTCPLLSTHLVYLVCVLPALAFQFVFVLCVKRSSCLLVSVIYGFLGFALPLPDFTFCLLPVGFVCLVRLYFLLQTHSVSESCSWVLLLVLPVITWWLYFQCITGSISGTDFLAKAHYK